MDWQEICIHNTANRASAMAEASYMVGHNMEISWHYAVDDYRAVQCLPLNRNGWHAGDGGNGRGNRTSIGIEICYSIDKGDKRYLIAQANAAILTARLLKSKNFGVNRIKIHRDYSGKYCPHRMLDNGHWDAFFKAQVQAELDKLNGVKPSKPEQKPVIPPTNIKAGSTVNVVGAKYATGQNIPDWVKKTSHKVYKVSGTSALLGHPDGINSWLHVKDLKVATTSAPAPKPKPEPKPAPKPTPTKIAKGSKVWIVGTHYATGQAIPSWVKSTSHVVAQVKDNKALLGYPKGISSWVYVKDLTVSDTPAATTKSQSGTWQTAVNINVRADVSTSSEIVAMYKAGMKINIKGTVTKNGYIWGFYTGASSGKTRYVALQPVGGSPYGKWV